MNFMYSWIYIINFTFPIYIYFVYQNTFVGFSNGVILSDFLLIYIYIDIYIDT